MNKVVRTKDLILNVKEIYFLQIQSGTKTYEYREIKPFWTKRLKTPYPGIQIRLGYPKADDKSKILRFAWNGFFVTTIDLMGEGMKNVYAFPLNETRI